MKEEKKKCGHLPPADPSGPAEKALPELAQETKNALPDLTQETKNALLELAQEIKKMLPELAQEDKDSSGNAT